MNIEKLDRRKYIFMRAYVESFGQMKKVAEVAGVDRSTPYVCRSQRDDEVFAECFKAVEKLVIEVIEQEIRRRAMEGFTRFDAT